MTTRVESYRYATTQDVMSINQLALKADLNRALTVEGMCQLDPDGKHLLVCVWVLDEHATLRGEWLLKMIDNEEPVLAFIDMLPGRLASVIAEELPYAFAYHYGEPLQPVATVAENY